MFLATLAQKSDPLSKNNLATLVKGSKICVSVARNTKSNFSLLKMAYCVNGRGRHLEVYKNALSYVTVFKNVVYLRKGEYF